MPAKPDILSEITPPKPPNETVQRLFSHHQREWELCAHDFWYFATKIRTLDEERKIYRSFPTNFDYLRKAKYGWDKHQKVIYLKPRRMLISYLATMRMMHRAMFCGTGLPDTFEIYFGGIASVDEDQAIYQSNRILQAYKKLPEWMQDRNPLVVQNQTLLVWQKGGRIQAFAMKREGPQGYGFSDFLFDEMAIQEAARSTWVGLVPTLGSSGGLLAVSTPNGKLNLFHDIWENKGNQYPGLHRMECDWWDNPEHDKAWFKQATVGLNPQQIARMYLKSFSVYEGKLVYPEFDDRTHLRDLEILQDSPMFIGHDFGFLSPANIYFQVNSKNQFLFHREYLDNEIGYDNFLKGAIPFENTFFRKDKGVIHFVDPAGRQRYASKARSGAINDIQEIKIQYGRFAKLSEPRPDPEVQVRFGALEIGTRVNEGPRLKEFRKLFNLREDGQPGMFVDKRCEILLEGFKGAYVFPDKRNELSQDNEQPIKNEASHVQDASQYGVTGHNRMNLIKQPEKTQERPKKIYHRLGF